MTIEVLNPSFPLHSMEVLELGNRSSELPSALFLEALVETVNSRPIGQPNDDLLGFLP